MEYKKYLSRELILLNPKNSDKKGLLLEFAEQIGKKIDVDSSKLHKILLDRESLGSTGIGHGVAIPHCKTDIYDNISILVALSKEGINFDSIDGKPVNLFFVIVASSKSQASYFRVLSNLSRMLQNSSSFNKLLESQTVDDLYNALIESE
ncbi:PTS sugar transporter subunit IIA [bacterium]|nr:PTS sugar transporter subunit IIA [bacterium]